VELEQMPRSRAAACVASGNCDKAGLLSKATEASKLSGFGSPRRGEKQPLTAAY